jgi:SAM-dependent methyltransferase
MERAMNMTIPSSGLQPQSPTPLSLAGMLESLDLGRDSEASWRDLRRSLLGLISFTNAQHVLEIGGGRSPFLTLDEAAEHDFEYTVNDIEEAELARAPAGFRTLCFDVARALPPEIPAGTFDVIFSRMVFEHVRDGRTAWRNLCHLLAPGGVGFAYVPTLYSPPFLVNALLPNFASAPILRLINADRNHDKEPKFPAYYDMCRASQSSLEPKLREAGFSEVHVVPFFGTPYFPVVPGLNRIARAFDRLVDRKGWTTFASYAYLVVRK